jgi:hypothetical protein
MLQIMNDECRLMQHVSTIEWSFAYVCPNVLQPLRIGNCYAQLQRYNSTCYKQTKISDV